MKIEIEDIDVWEAVADAVKEAFERCNDEIYELQNAVSNSKDGIDITELQGLKTKLDNIVSRAKLYKQYLAVWDSTSTQALIEAVNKMKAKYGLVDEDLKK